MQFRLPEVYVDAKKSLEQSLKDNKLKLGRYNTSLVNLCDVTHFNIKEEEEENVGSITLLISYRERIITRYEKFETLNRTQTLTILNPKGDKIWPYVMIAKVWNGVYPSAVAINEETGVVYLVYLMEDSLGLTEFALLKENQLEAVVESINDKEPYRFGLDEDAMFKVLSEIEGTRLLHETVFIEFDCGIKFRVYNEN